MTQHYPFSDLSELNYSKERRILNEQLFYEMNKRIIGTTENLLSQAKTDLNEVSLKIACECSDASCLKKIQVTVQTFNDIHDVPGQYILMPGHEQSDIEEVMHSNDDYIVVMKFNKDLLANVG